MVNWTNVLSHKVGKEAVKRFALGEYNCEKIQQIFRAGQDREASGDVRRLIRTRGTQEARRIAKKALRRRNLI
jgi:hypothetical protein